MKYRISKVINKDNKIIYRVQRKLFFIWYTISTHRCEFEANIKIERIKNNYKYI